MKMMRLSLLFLFINLYFPGLKATVCAKGDTLVIDPEVMRAIRGGTFLNLDPAPTKWKNSGSSLPITRDFSEYIHPDTLFPEERPLENIPPSVFMLKQIGHANSRLKVREEAFQREQEKVLLPPSVVIVPRTGIYGKVGATMLDDVGDGQRRGAVGLRLGISFSLDDMLQYIFYEHVRNRKKNRRRANTWKYYNDYPTY